MDKDTLRLFGWVCGILALLMFVALLDNNYGYYVFLRWVTFLGAGSMAIYFYNNKSDEDEYAFVIPVVIALLWNPIIPIFMSRGTWVFFNVIAGIYFVIQAMGLFEKASRYD